MPRRWLAILVGVLVAALVGCGGESGSTGERSTAGTAVQQVQKFDPTDLAAVQSRWWTWAASAPPATNPVVDTTGAQCAVNQPKDVWFVAGSFGGTVERRCDVPAGRPLAGPAVNLLAQDRIDCDDFMRDAKGDVTLDGTPVDLHLIAPTGMTFQAKPGNPVTSQGGEHRVLGCGLWFAISSLSPGEHVLVISGSSSDFAVKATYHLTVAPPV